MEIILTTLWSGRVKDYYTSNQITCILIFALSLTNGAVWGMLSKHLGSHIHCRVKVLDQIISKVNFKPEIT